VTPAEIARNRAYHEHVEGGATQAEMIAELKKLRARAEAIGGRTPSHIVEAIDRLLSERGE
jgi:hypothetical protein